MKKRIVPLIVLILFYIAGNDTLSASELEDPMVAIQVQIDALELDNIKKVINKSNTAYEVDFEDLIVQTISGELDLSLSGILQGAVKMVFNELFENTALLKNLLVIGILSALLKTLTDSFQNKSVGEIGFYVSYMALIMVLYSSFMIGVRILSSLVSTISDFIYAAIPLFTGLVLMSGNFTGAYVFNTLLVFAVNIITSMISNLFVPMIIIISTLQIVNYLTENEVLSNLSELLKNIVTWALKAVAICFVSLITIQKISAPILNNLAVKTAKNTVNVVPVVGEVLTGAVDTVINWIQACQSGVLVAALIAVVALCAVPVIKLVALIIVYKLTAAVIQPICDKRIVKCIDTIGNYTGLMLSSAMIVVSGFVIAAMVMLSF